MNERKEKEKALQEELALEKKRAEDFLKQFNAIKEKDKNVVTPVDEELVELKKELERKNLDYTQ